MNFEKPGKFLKFKNKIARNIQISARILAGIDSLVGIFVLGTFLVVGLMWTGNLLNLIFILPIIAVIGFYIISLKTELVGGILLIIEGIGFLVFLWIVHWYERSPFITLLVSIPFLISGILYIFAWYFEKSMISY
jgi:hypothetical protein